jgi:hypothetical protein
MENPIHSPWKRTSLSHSQRTGFPQLRIKASYTHSHNAYCGEYLSFPILSEKRAKAKKEAGAQPSDEPRSCTPALCYEKCGKLELFFGVSA